MNSASPNLVAPARNTTLKWGAVMLVVAACVGYLIYSASGGSSEYYLTVAELRAHPQSGDVRVAGVVQGDVVRTDGGLRVRFTEKDSTASVLVDYQGPLPDIFQPGPPGTRLAWCRVGQNSSDPLPFVIAQVPVGHDALPGILI